MKVLAIDEDRAHAALVAQAFNQAGMPLRYLSDRKKTLAGLRQLRPELLLVNAEVRSTQVSELLLALARDVAFANLPIVLLCTDLTDAPFLSGLRSGIVGLLHKPFFAARHVQELQTLWAELPGRNGTVLGHGDSKQLALLIEHVRRTQRSGQVTLEATGPKAGKAHFVAGKLESAAYQGLHGVEALVAMVTLPSANWSFTELGGAGGEGAGVVIEVSSESHSGEIDVPLEEVPDEPLGNFEFSLESEPSQKAAKAPPQTPARLLLVDDDPTLCQMFSRLFSKHGFAVTTAGDGQQGFEAALQGEFDAVIADLDMPHLDGWGLLRLLREDFRSRELPVAFLSCHDDYRDALKALDAGAQAYFSKDTRLEALVAKVHELLEPRQQARAQLSRVPRTGLPIAVGAVGPQWLLSQLAERALDGRLDAKDGWAHYQLYFAKGAAVHAGAQAGRFSAEGERAFNAFVASRGAQGVFHPGPQPAPSTLRSGGREQLQRACAVLNENERRLREGLLLGAAHIEVDKDLYTLYAQVGPKQRLEAARLICEDKLAPREVISRLDASPVEVEETLKDLLRRGVVTLAA